MKNLLFIFMYLLIGCKEYVEEDMTISVPIGINPITISTDTNVTDSTQAYDSTAVYNDGDVVQQNNNLYNVAVTYYDQQDAIPWTLTGGYPAGTFVSYYGNIYKAGFNISPAPAGWNSLAPVYYGSYILCAENTVRNFTQYKLFTGDGQVMSWSGPGRGAGEFYILTFTLTNAVTNTYSVHIEIGYYDLSFTKVYDTNVTESWTIKKSFELTHTVGTKFLYNGYLYNVIDAAYGSPTPDTVWSTTPCLGMNDAWTEVADITEVIKKYDLHLISPINPLKPFDDRNYSIATIATQMTYTISGNSKFDTLALGHVKADSATIVFTLPVSSPNYDLWLDGAEVASGGNGVVISVTRSIDTARDTLGSLEKWHTTEIFYSPILMDIDSTVSITLDITAGEIVELGSIILGHSVSAGYSNLSMSHTYKDFSVAEYDAWGNIDYVEKQRLNTYRGTVDVDITNYDMTIRLMTSLGKQLVIVNGSTSKTVAPDSQSIFASTQLIGRFITFDSKTKIKDNVLDQKAEYSFVLEELA